MNFDFNTAALEAIHKIDHGFRKIRGLPYWEKLLREKFLSGIIFTVNSRFSLKFFTSEDSYRAIIRLRMQR